MIYVCVALFQMHSSMCLELKKLVDRVMRIFPDIENARPGCSSGIQTLCLLHKALDKAKLLLQYCSESSKLYMVCEKTQTFSHVCYRNNWTCDVLFIAMWSNVINPFLFDLQAVTGDAILSRGCRAKKSLEQSLTDIRSMVPTVLAIKVCAKLCFPSPLMF